MTCTCGEQAQINEQIAKALRDAAERIEETGFQRSRITTCLFLRRRADEFDGGNAGPNALDLEKPLYDYHREHVQEIADLGIPVVLNPEAIGNPNLTPTVTLPTADTEESDRG